MARAMLSLQAVFAELGALPFDRNGAAILRRGQALLAAAPPLRSRPASASCSGSPVAFGVIEGDYFVSTRGSIRKGSLTFPWVDDRDARTRLVAAVQIVQAKAKR